MLGLAIVRSKKLMEKETMVLWSFHPYWWIVCSEKFFNSRRLSYAEKILESVLAYQVLLNTSTS
jgi:hypothetical protein